MTQDPKRLMDQADDLGNAIAALQRQAPSQRSLEAMALRLAAAGAPVEPLEPLADPPVGEVSRLVPGRKLRLVSARRFVNTGVLLVILALGVGAGLIATAVAIVTPYAPPAPPPVSAPGTPEVAAATATSTHPSHAESRSAEAPTHLAAPGVATERVTRADDLAAPAATNVDPSPAAPAAGAAALPLAPTPTPAASHEPAVAMAAPRTTSAARTPQRASNESTSTNTGAPLAESTVVESEVELLKQAKSALGADPLQAFALTERCRGRYPNGSFSQEREYIAISALARLGRGDEARSRAALFRMHYPNSAYLTRLASLLGEP